MSQSRFETLLANYCAPTLKQYKLANMFHIKKDPTVLEYIAYFNENLNSKGIYFKLIDQGERYTIYVYNSKLKDYISSSKVRTFLNTYQYPSSFESCLQELQKRLNKEKFPHEIGVFLGYPLADVIGFIENKPCYFIGDWKVYQNVEQAKKQFELYKQTKDSMLNLIHSGYHLTQIV